MTDETLPQADPAPPAPGIIRITGITAAGRSSVAQPLAGRLPRSVHPRRDLFRRTIVNGRIDADPGVAAGLAQLRLHDDLAAALGYRAAGFTVVYQDVVQGPDLPQVIARLGPAPLHLVVLMPKARGRRGTGNIAAKARRRRPERRRPRPCTPHRHASDRPLAR